MLVRSVCLLLTEVWATRPARLAGSELVRSGTAVLQRMLGAGVRWLLVLLAGKLASGHTCHQDPDYSCLDTQATLTLTLTDRVAGVVVADVLPAASRGGGWVLPLGPGHLLL